MTCGDGGGVQVLQSEQDLSTKRNAFQMLCNHAQDLATNYLLSQVCRLRLSWPVYADALLQGVPRPYDASAGLAVPVLHRTARVTCSVQKLSSLVHVKQHASSVLSLSAKRIAVLTPFIAERVGNVTLWDAPCMYLC